MVSILRILVTTAIFCVATSADTFFPTARPTSVPTFLPTAVPGLFTYKIIGNNSFGNNTCESNGWETILDVNACQQAGAVLSNNPNKSFALDQPLGGYQNTGADRTRGCTFNNGLITNALQFFPLAQGFCGKYSFYCICKVPYTVVASGTCEARGMVTILDASGCQRAGFALSGNPNKAFALDQPQGGYLTTGSDRTRGCTLNGGVVSNPLQLFPYAQGTCGTYSFNCICKAPAPTPRPTAVPTLRPTSVPTVKPSLLPTFRPSSLPTRLPSLFPTTRFPTIPPTPAPTIPPTPSPTTSSPTPLPTLEPTPLPTTVVPTNGPTDSPTPSPTTASPPPVPTYVPFKLYEIVSSGTCEDHGLLTILDLGACQLAGAALSGDLDKGFRFDQPEGGYLDTGSDRTRGCTLHMGNIANPLQFFPQAQGECGTYGFECVCKLPFEVLGSGTCEGRGMLPIVDLEECQRAGAILSSDPSKGFRFDQPQGGYLDTGADRTRGCTLHMGTVANPMQFFPLAQGDCGTNGFFCVCKAFEIVSSGTCEDRGLATIVDLDTCRLAGAMLSGDLAKGFYPDQPQGGYLDDGSDRTRGCTLAHGDVNYPMQFFPLAQGACDTYSFFCVCKAPALLTLPSPL